jgi:hypothetical protein
VTSGEASTEYHEYKRSGKIVSVSEHVLQTLRSKVVGIPSHVIIKSGIISPAFTGDKWGSGLLVAPRPHHHPFAEWRAEPFC